ncbi:type VII secretion target [Williamsia sp.]|uniref:type VII secretion target n=1 Tax=Williamsia sp. TaxID=1872085 RepID=UPI002F939912
MTSVSVEPAALTTAAAGTRSVGAQIAAYAAAGRVEAVGLIPTFGLMGAEFAAAAVMVTERHTSELTALASRIDTLATGLQQSAITYSGADDANAQQISAVQTKAL